MPVTLPAISTRYRETLLNSSVIKVLCSQDIIMALATRTHMRFFCQMTGVSRNLRPQTLETSEERVSRNLRPRNLGSEVSRV